MIVEQIKTREELEMFVIKLIDRMVTIPSNLTFELTIAEEDWKPFFENIPEGEMREKFQNPRTSRYNTQWGISFNLNRQE
jgi:hypothetical protein